jgi:hypothetical protein
MLRFMKVAISLLGRGWHTTVSRSEQENYPQIVFNFWRVSLVGTGRNKKQVAVMMPSETLTLCCVMRTESELG